MTIRIFTIAFDPIQEIFPDDELAQFLLNKRVKEIKSEFFKQNHKAYWTVWVDYDTVLAPVKANLDSLNDAQRLLYKRLQEWRKDTSQKEGVPVFIIATNKQLVEVVKRLPKTKEALRAISGFGSKKLERYGQTVIGIVTSFFEKKPLHGKDTKGGGTSTPKPNSQNEKQSEPIQ